MSHQHVNSYQYFCVLYILIEKERDVVVQGVAMIAIRESIKQAQRD